MSGVRFSYLPQLDGIRALAVVMIMLAHSQTGIIAGAYLSVDIFFVISGFLIISLLIREYDKTGHIKLGQFYLRRFLRLTPAVVVVLLVFIAIAAVDNELSLNSTVRRAIYAILNVMNVVRAEGISGGGIFGHMWSLSLQEQFYLVGAAVLLFLLRSRLAREHSALLLVGVAVVLWVWRLHLMESGASLDRIYNGTDTRIGALIVGAALGLFLSTSSGLRLVETFQRHRLLSAGAVVLAALTLVYGTLYTTWRQNTSYVVMLPLAELATVVLLVGLLVVPAHPLFRFLQWRPLRLVGLVSYGLYIWHFPIYMFLFEYEISPQDVLIWGSIITAGFAVASYRWIEMPMIRWKARKSPTSAPVAPAAVSADLTS